MEIISGLNLTPVYRLRKTWDALPRKYVTLFEQLTALMDSKGNFKVYREELHTKDPPCVPFLGLYLTDLTFIEGMVFLCCVDKRKINTLIRVGEGFRGGND